MARLLGRDGKKEVVRILNFCVHAMAFVGIAILVVGLATIEPMAKLSGADEENIAYACDYLFNIFLGAPFIILSNGAVHLFRSLGLIGESTIGLAIGSSVNIVLDFVFIVYCGWETSGAALATSLGFLCSTVYYLACPMRSMKRGNELINLSMRCFSIDRKLVFDVVGIGIPGALITVLLSISDIVLDNFIGAYGSDAVAAYGIAYKIDMVPVMLSVGMSQGVAPLLGYCYGSGRIERMVRTMRISIPYGGAMGAFFLAAFCLFGTQMARFFLSDGLLADQAGYFIAILGLSAPMLGIINLRQAISRLLALR